MLLYLFGLLVRRYVLSTDPFFLPSLHSKMARLLFRMCCLRSTQEANSSLKAMSHLPGMTSLGFAVVRWKNGFP